MVLINITIDERLSLIDCRATVPLRSPATPKEEQLALKLRSFLMENMRQEICGENANEVIIDHDIPANFRSDSPSTNQ